MTASKPTAVIGIGNAFRTDDAVGLYVAEQVRSRGLEGVSVVEGIPDGYALIDAWAGADRAYVVDCASSGAAPGTTYRFDAVRESIPAELFSGLSTHSIAVTDAIDLARTLGRLPAELVVYGIEGENVSAGHGLTSAVQASADRIVDAVLEEIRTATNS